MIMTTPPGGWTDEDKVALIPTKRNIYHAIPASAPVVRLTPISGPARIYRLTRIVENGPFWTFAGIRINKAGRIVGNGGTRYICDVQNNGKLFGGLGGRFEVVA